MWYDMLSKCRGGSGEGADNPPSAGILTVKIFFAHLKDYSELRPLEILDPLRTAHIQACDNSATFV